MTGLRQRKQQRVRADIVRAAFELFAERGFADVTVADIAERAEVGRTTFFRYFGDKQEVAFSDEGLVLDEWQTRTADLPPVTTLAQALAQLREVAIDMCRVVTEDPRRFLVHQRLLRANPELRDRSHRKFDGMCARLRDTLLARGTPPAVAALAPQVAFGCYRAAVELTEDDPAALPDAVAAAFDALARP
ncbi:TetR family transcriptional regulator [Actinosynnema sp. NPDC020468]|uniref:TetR/AcrR family transcriptional regulator n=1 Tax=Actinosynnema sp. NPDC020468 TaxID=3154488 RepID=UPI0033F5B77A